MPAPTPELIVEAFAVNAGGPYITNPIPVPSQIGITDGAASYNDGFPPKTMTALGAGGIPPAGADLNGIFFMISGHTVWVQAGQPYVFNSTLAAAISGYGVGAVLARSDGTGFWLNLLSGNVSDPDAGGAGWVPAFNYGSTSVAVTSGNTTLTADQYAREFIIITGALSGNVTVTFPDFKQQWLVVNNTTNAHTVTVQGSVTGVVVPQTGFAGATNIFGDGAGNIYTNAISTAGLAPLNSPAFTGTPTGPTAAVDTNTTQLATTAFVQQELAEDLTDYAPLASPVLTGNPTAPTQTLGDNSVKLATTAFVEAALAANTSLLATGHTKFGSGLILQWGKAGPAPGGNAPFVVTFPIAFPNAVFGIQLTAVPSDGTQAVNSNTLTNFTMQNGAGGTFTYWLAYGW